MRGQEIMSGAQRIRSYKQLCENMRRNDPPLDPESEGFRFYIDAFKYWCVPHDGGGLGFNRILQFYLGLPDIRFATLFPRDPTRKAPWGRPGWGWWGLLGISWRLEKLLGMDRIHGTWKFTPWTMGHVFLGHDRKVRKNEETLPPFLKPLFKTSPILSDLCLSLCAANLLPPPPPLR